MFRGSPWKIDRLQCRQQCKHLVNIIYYNVFINTIVKWTPNSFFLNKFLVNYWLLLILWKSQHTKTFDIKWTCSILDSKRVTSKWLEPSSASQTFPFTYGTNKCAAQYTPHVMRFMVNIYRMTIIKNIEKNTLNTKKIFLIWSY